MAQYLIRTDREKKKTHILRVDVPIESAGLIYTDFNLVPGNKDIRTEDIVNSLSNKSLAQIKLYKNGNVISVNSRRKELSTFTENGEYKEDGLIIPYRKMTRDVLLSRTEYKTLEEMGISHAYFLGDRSVLSQVFCFEKDGNISGMVYSKEKDDVSALRGITLTFAQKIENQEFIFEFMKK